MVVILAEPVQIQVFVVALGRLTRIARYPPPFFAPCQSAYIRSFAGGMLKWALGSLETRMLCRGREKSADASISTGTCRAASGGFPADRGFAAAAGRWLPACVCGLDACGVHTRMDKLMLLFVLRMQKASLPCAFEGSC